MTSPLSKEQVLALAPDASSAKAAASLAAEGKWESLGADDAAAWGECKGSGAKPYQTQVELATLSSRCSCPSRKFPCKHGLALLLLYAQPSPRFAQPSEQPAWVAEWLTARQQKAAKKEQAATERQAQDPAAAAAAAAKREAARWKRIEAGTADLSRWIADQFRHGLAQFGHEQREAGHGMAARMVDAQAPGLEQPLLAALAALAHGSAGSEEAAERLGLLQLLCEGVRRRTNLSAARMADIRAALGWPLDKDELLGDASADAQTDQWDVLGVALDSRDERLSERRVWLRGATSGRYALLLDFAFRCAAWDSQWLAGMRYPAHLRFYPGSAPLRALAENQGAGEAAPAWHDAPAITAEHASHWLAANPWLPRVPLWLDTAQILPENDGWSAQTPHGRYPLRIETQAAWLLLAFGGGHALRLMGEWDGRTLLPLSACVAAAPAQRLDLGNRLA